MVVAKQPESQWAVLEGHPWGAKSIWGVKMINLTIANSIKRGSCEQWKRGGRKEKWGRKKRIEKQRKKKNT